MNDQKERKIEGYLESLTEIHDDYFEYIITEDGKYRYPFYKVKTGGTVDFPQYTYIMYRKIST